MQPHRYSFIRFAAFTLIICFCLPASAQKQGNIWYFGRNAGLDFNSGSPVALTDGLVLDGEYHLEGTSVISDSEGKLLFYTNGQKIWNRWHGVMPNGAGLKGHYSSTQGSLIVPRPGSSRYFYVFTTDAFLNNLKNGFRYSIVDMCLHRGLGDVIPGEKNILLLDTVAEKLTAVRHANGLDYWIVVHKYVSDAFYAYHLTPNGIDTIPVVSYSGSVHKMYCTFPDHWGGTVNSMGWMTISPNGQKLALVTSQGCNNISEVFDFDNATGQVSNPIALYADTISQGMYGVCFSPDNSKLYYSSFDPFDKTYLYQFDLDADGGSASAIRDSKALIMTTVPSVALSLQLGPDGKIYLNDSNYYLSVIHSPNLAGTACNLQNHAVYLGGQRNSLGLPNFITDYDYSNTPLTGFWFSLGSDTTLCTNTPLTLNTRLPHDTYTFKWQDLSADSAYTATASGVYTVTVSNPTSGCEASDTLTVTFVQPVPLNLGNDTTVCPNTSVTLDASTPQASYQWSNGAQSYKINVSTPGTYSVIVTYNGCLYYDTIKVDTIHITPVDLGKDSSYCFHQPVTLIPWSATANDAYLWSDGSSGNVLKVVTAGTYRVTARKGSCLVHDTITLTQQPVPLVNLGNDTSLCKENNLLTLDAKNPGDGYQWNDLSVTQTKQGVAPGTYSVIVTNQYGCSDTDQIMLDTLPSPVVNLGNDTFFCTGTSLQLDAGTGLLSYLWNNGSSAQTIVVQDSGIYAVRIKDEYGCTADDEIELSIKPKPILSLINMIKVCNPDFTINPGNSFIAYHWQDNSAEPVFRVTDYGEYSVTVTDSNFCTNSLNISVENNCPAALFVPNAFTPNGDHLNDVFKAETFNIETLQMKIYDRWGALVFETTELGKGWNGKLESGLATPDVYVYAITYTGNNGETEQRSGNFTLLR